jgi:hypothetical protein
MIGRKAIIGLTMLCALLVSAFAAQAASAVGTTAYTCTNTGTPTGANRFSEAHCKTVSNPSGAFFHVAIPAKTTTEIEGSDKSLSGEHTGAKLKATVAGSAIELVAKEVSGTGTMTNTETGGEMIASGEGKIKYSGVTEKLLGCKVVGIPGGEGVVETQQLFASTAGVGDKLKFTPKEGTTFAEFKLEGCAVANTYKVIGSVLGVPDGATTNTVHNKVTEEKTLRLQSAVGPVAGIEGTLTIRGRVTGSGSAYTPLSVTT